MNIYCWRKSLNIGHMSAVDKFSSITEKLCRNALYKSDLHYRRKKNPNPINVLVRNISLDLLTDPGTFFEGL